MHKPGTPLLAQALPNLLRLAQGATWRGSSLDLQVHLFTSLTWASQHGLKEEVKVAGLLRGMANATGLPLGSIISDTSGSPEIAQLLEDAHLVDIMAGVLGDIPNAALWMTLKQCPPALQQLCLVEGLATTQTLEMGCLQHPRGWWDWFDGAGIALIRHLRTLSDLLWCLENGTLQDHFRDKVAALERRGEQRALQWLLRAMPQRQQWPEAEVQLVLSRLDRKTLFEALAAPNWEPLRSIFLGGLSPYAQAGFDEVLKVQGTWQETSRRAQKTITELVREFVFAGTISWKVPWKPFESVTVTFHSGPAYADPAFDGAILRADEADLQQGIATIQLTDLPTALLAASPLVRAKLMKALPLHAASMGDAMEYHPPTDLRYIWQIQGQMVWAFQGWRLA